MRTDPTPPASAPAAALAEPLQEEESLGRELRRQIAAAPWYLASTGLHLVLLLFLLLIPTVRPEPAREEVTLTMQVPPATPPASQPPPPPPPTKQILERIRTETRTVKARAESQARTHETVPAPAVEVDTNPEVDAVAGLAEDLVSVDDPVDAAEPSKPVMAVGRSWSAMRRTGPSGHRRGGIGQIAPGLRDALDLGAPGPGGHGRPLLVVWLLDQSASMKDDQAALAGQAREIRDLLTDGGQARMESAVVTYGRRWQVTQAPTRRAAAITEAIGNVAPDSSGTENTCQALVFTCQRLLEKRVGWTKVVVLLTDENAGDAADRYDGFSDPLARKAYGLDLTSGQRRLPLLEVALRELVRTRTRLFVIGKESPFQFDRVRTILTDAEGRRHRRRVDLGPESARLEVRVAFSQNQDPRDWHAFRGDEVTSGFGVYDLAYLARHSGGAYFILDPQPYRERQRPRSYYRRNPFVIDWPGMRRYEPAWVSRAEYPRRLREAGRWGEKVRQLQERFDRAEDIARHRHVRPPSRFRARREALRRRAALLETLLPVVAETRATPAELAAAERRRQIANIDLWYAVLLADQMITSAWLNAYEAYRGPVDDAAPEDQWAELVLQPEEDAALAAEDEALFAARLARFTQASNDVIRRHPNTPWAICAHWMQRGPRTWGRPLRLVRRTHRHGGGPSVPGPGGM